MDSVSQARIYGTTEFRKKMKPYILAQSLARNKPEYKKLCVSHYHPNHTEKEVPPWKGRLQSSLEGCDVRGMGRARLQPLGGATFYFVCLSV